MDVSLRPFTAADVGASKAWRAAIRLEEFMSRSAPFRFNGTVDESSPEYRWFVIVADGESVGTIWLEREPDEPAVARLGIFLAAKSHFGKGIGRKAIAKAIQMCRPLLGFDRVRLHVRLNNGRAIACYRASGFRPVERFTKTINDAAVEVLRMEREA